MRFSYVIVIAFFINGLCFAGVKNSRLKGIRQEMGEATQQPIELAAVSTCSDCEDVDLIETNFEEYLEPPTIRLQVNEYTLDALANIKTISASCSHLCIELEKCPICGVCSKNTLDLLY